ncbi:MAG TPA: ankyrin repeat domain-containing protein [Gammaproteobacteria bacterium]
MRSWKLAAIAVLSAATAALPGIASAQQSLAKYVRDGKRDIVLAAITSPDVDVDQTEPDGSTALHWAVYEVDHELVRALLDAGATVNVTSRYGSTPLTEAVKVGDLELVRMLLDAGADPDSPNQDNQTALMLAASIGSLEIAKLLIERGADVNAIETFRSQNALMWAAGENHPEIVDLLLANGATDLDRRAAYDDWPRQMTSEPRAQFRQTGGLTALLYATRSGCYRCVVSLIEAGADIDRPNPDGITPLINAIGSRHFDIAMYLIDQGAKVDVWDMYGRTPLYMAIDMSSFRGGRGFGGAGGRGGEDGVGDEPRGESAVGALDIARRLIDMGVDVNHELTRMRPNGPGRGRFADYMMRGGTGPLMVATLAHDHEAIELLLANGAEVDLPNVFQITPLMAAAGMSGTVRAGGGRTGQGPDFEATVIKTIDLLLDAGANIDAQVFDSHTNTAKQDSYIPGADNEGKTALHAAAEMGWARVVQHLLDRGADPTIKDAYGNTALDLAMRRRGGGAGGFGRGAGGEAPAGPTVVDVLREAMQSARAD